MSVVANSRASELTREDVIAAAAELVAERGYAGLSMRALAQRCGVATMTLYRHVRTKEDLLVALMTDRMSRIIVSGRLRNNSIERGE